MESQRFFNPLDAIDIHRRHLPHWWQPGVSVFVTWRLADALPETLLKPWREQREAWLAAHPRPWSAEDEAEYFRRFGTEIVNPQGVWPCFVSFSGNGPENKAAI